MQRDRDLWKLSGVTRTASRRRPRCRTLDSLVSGGVRGGRRSYRKTPRLILLHAIDRPTWRALEQTIARLEEARRIALSLETEIAGNPRSQDRFRSPHRLPYLDGVHRWQKALQALSEARGERDTPLVQELSVDEKIAGLVNAIRFDNNEGLRTSTTRPLADPAQARDRIPPESWLRAAFLPRPTRRIHFRFLLDGEPVEGIGVVPVLKVKNPAGDLKELHELWSR